MLESLSDETAATETRSKSRRVNPLYNISTPTKHPAIVGIQDAWRYQEGQDQIVKPETLTPELDTPIKP